MILDTLDHASQYSPLGPKIARGLSWLADFRVELPDGRYPIDGDAVYALVQSYGTVAPGEKKFESHRVHLDIQYIAAGVEVIEYAPVSALVPATAYDAAKDCQFYADPGQATPLLLPPGSFAIFHPQDGHKPGCWNGGPSQIKKVVIKALA